ncbi:glycerol kinase GlpK [Candidatus Poribacteria bacterium]|nr:glycerol kinase GlpK [Candidatus Poribacteria bacterium]MYK21231.1 glycerol kinase GlpK [Candidatus Poribacteria bacterium]
MPNTACILAIDQGTTGTTALLVDVAGNIVARGYQEFTQYYPHPGWVEHAPEEIWNATRQAIDALFGETVPNIIALGITNQRETTLIWDRQTGKPVYPAIVWQCRRTADRCTSLEKQGVAGEIKTKTGLVLDAYFSATKIAWILDNVNGARGQAERGELAFGTVDTWLLWKLTDGAVHKTDYTNAARTLLFNINTLSWDDTLLEIFNVPKAILPEVYPSANNFGTASFYRNFWLETFGKNICLDGIPIAGIAGDQQAALFGQLCTEPGMVKNTYGTGCFLMLNTGAEKIETETGLLTTLACSLDETPVYALEGSVFVAGAAVQWLRDGIQIIENAAETEAIASSIPDSGGVFVVPAFTGLGAPYWDADARGAILGLTRGSTRAQVIRATLESIAYQSADVVTAMVAAADLRIDRLRVDGGATVNDFLMQFQADILGIDVERPAHIESTGLGAAYLAGITAGMWNDIAELEAYRSAQATSADEVSTGRVFSPEIDRNERHQKLSQWKKAVQRVMSC